MRRFYRLFPVCYLLLCAVPMLILLCFGPAEPAANQTLPAAPSLTRPGGGFNDEVLTELSDYTAQRFGLRQELVTLYARLNAAVFSESATDSVILGKDGWLFYADTLADYEGASALSDRSLWSAARTLFLIQEYASTQGAEFLFVMAPNKNTLYPAYMPDRFPRAQEPGNWERLQAQLQQQGVAYVDLTEVFGQLPSPAYYKTDSHWTPYGSAVAHDAILAALGRSSDLSGETFTSAVHTGDLYAMLYPASEGGETAPVLARERTFSHVGAFRSPEDMTIRTESGSGQGSLLMFRDSFGNTLYADMAESFATACFSRSMPLRLDLLASDPAETVVVELVERNLSWLATRPPVMPAPARTLEESPAAGAAAVPVSRQPAAQLDGLICYSGAVPELDADSPILLSLDGVLYEASPAGEGEGAFTLYGPEASEVSVLYRQGGVWYAADAE